MVDRAPTSTYRLQLHTGIAEAVRRGRRNEFASHGWDGADIPDPQSEETAARSRLDWGELTTPKHARLLEWYTALVRLRRERRELGDPRLDLVKVEHDHEAGTVVVRRGNQVVAVNLAQQQRRLDLRAEPSGGIEIVLAWVPGSTRLDGTVLTLPPESAAIVGPAA